MTRRVLQSAFHPMLLAVLLLGGGAAAQNLNLEFRQPTGENFFARHVWLCEECDLADWAAATPAPGFEQVPPRVALFDSASFVPPVPPPGVPAALDFVPTVPGAESVYVAKLLDAQILALHPALLVLARVKRDTRLHYQPGTVVHQVVDPSGASYTLFTFDLQLSTLVDLTQVGSLASLPLPPGWTYTSRQLTSDLLVVSNGLANVFAQGGLATWQRNEPIQVEVVVKPGDAPEVNPGSSGVIPVAVFGEEDFGVSTIDVSTLRLGPGEAAPAHAAGGHVEQLDGDGIADLVSHHRVADTGIQPGDVEVCVSGSTLEGVPFQGCGAITTP